MRSCVMRDLFCLLRQGNMCMYVAECRETVSVQTVVFMHVVCVEPASLAGSSPSKPLRRALWLQQHCGIGSGDNDVCDKGCTK